VAQRAAGRISSEWAPAGGPPCGRHHPLAAGAVFGERKGSSRRSPVLTLGYEPNLYPRSDLFDTTYGPPDLDHRPGVRVKLSWGWRHNFLGHRNTLEPYASGRRKVAFIKEQSVYRTQRPDLPAPDAPLCPPPEAGPDPSGKRNGGNRRRDHGRVPGAADHPALRPHSQGGRQPCRRGRFFRRTAIPPMTQRPWAG
jgi:hypothetical protein